MSSTRLLVLGVVRLFQPVHGYDVRRELLSWRAEQWGNASPGSIYNALKSLTRDGLLEVVGTDQVGGRPERTTYRLTKEGEDEFRSSLREAWWTVGVPADPLLPAVSFMNTMRRDELVRALEHRVQRIAGVIEQLEFAKNDHSDEARPEHVREMFSLMIARIGSEVDWAKDLIAALARGEHPSVGVRDPATVADNAGHAERRAAAGPTAPPATRDARRKKPSTRRAVRGVDRAQKGSRVEQPSRVSESSVRPAHRAGSKKSAHGKRR